MPTDIVVTKRNRALWIELNRPDVRNAIRLGVTTTETIEALNTAAADEDVRAVVITGRGTSFCAGGDVKEMAKALQSDRPDATRIREQVREFHKMIEAIHEIEKPVIAAVNGPAMGAGCNLALVCDLRIASDQAKFCEAFVHRGLTSDAGSTYLLPRLVGYAKAFELLTLGDTFDAHEALRLGLVNKVVPHDQLIPETEALVARYAAAPARAVALIKRGLRLAATASLHDTLEVEAAMQAVTMTGAEHREGVQAFLEKRQPNFG
ncbi:MAG: enoyl-CoA hydratase-related protein [FCB group bacterium]|jgi:2-(1,2-epoxy-1,2-dihydrophenyl)acetyl-CoA isomerase|nr:enoyl-CoA hydratase-related protein [FCB group bacterium]